MSFLNPVNEPVLRFSSTDVGAPQISYNARVAGDVKAVLKACLVTGYGTIASAGWSIVNEVAHVAEFVSPSAAMSDYRLGIDDTSVSATTWYYQYKNSKVNISGSSVDKTALGIELGNAANGWDVIVTDRGLFLVESFYHTGTKSIGSSVTYWGKLKSGAPELTGENIAWWCLGYNSGSPNKGRPSDFFSSVSGLGRHYKIENLTVSDYGHPAIKILSTYIIGQPIQAKSDSVLASDWYLIADRNIIAAQPGLVLSAKADSNAKSSRFLGDFQGRPALYVWPIRGSIYESDIFGSSNAIVIIFLDSWSY